jgi:hypothetical protein
MAELHRELPLFRGKTNGAGAKLPKAQIQQTTVMFYPRSPPTILVTDLLPLELITFGTSGGAELWKSHPY